MRALDIAKALIDRGFHAPTIYFPLIVKEAIMIEPTETESQGNPGPVRGRPASTSWPWPTAILNP